MLSWLKQVRFGGRQPEEATDDETIECNVINMNGSSRGICSCPNQRCNNRLTSNNNNNNDNENNINIALHSVNSNNSTGKTLVPLIINVTLLMLAIPSMDAATVKRSVAETETNFYLTTAINTPLPAIVQNEYTAANTPLAANEQLSTVDQTTTNNLPPQPVVDFATTNNSPQPSPIVEKIDYTTADNTPTNLANAQTIESDNADADVSIVNGTIDTVGAKQNDTQDVNNEISQAAAVEEGIVTAEVVKVVELKPDPIKPKFDYTETLLDGNLEENIRNSVKNEIEFEHDIGAAVIEQLQEIADPQERQKLTEEIFSIQNAQKQQQKQQQQQQQLASANDTATEVGDVASELTSIESASIPAATESGAAVRHATTTPADLSIYYPAKSEERSLEEEQSDSSNQRNGKTLDENPKEQLSESKLETNDIAENDGAQNIQAEKEKENLVNDLQNEGEEEGSSATVLNQVPESTIQTQESNEITEEDVATSTQQLEEAEDNNEQEAAAKNIEAATENQNVEDGKADDEEDGDEKDENANDKQENEFSVVLDENLNKTKETMQNDESIVQIAANNPIELKEAKIGPDDGDKPSVSIVLDENLAATEPLVNEELRQILSTDSSLPFLNVGEIKTTVNSGIEEKNVHVVVKKQGLELKVVSVTNLTAVKEMEKEKERIAELERENQKRREEEKKKYLEEHPYEDPDYHGVILEMDPWTNEVDAKIVITEKEREREEAQMKQLLKDREALKKRDEEERKREQEEEEEEEEEEDAKRKQDEGGETKIKQAEKTDAKRQQEEAEETKRKQEGEEETKINQATKEYTTASEDTDESDDTAPTTEEATTADAHTGTQTTNMPTTEQAFTASSGSATTTIVSSHTTITLNKVEASDEMYEDHTHNPHIVPILEGVSVAQGDHDQTASTKGSRSISAQTHHSMLLAHTMDDGMAATLFGTMPLQQHANQMFNRERLAAESGDEARLIGGGGGGGGDGGKPVAHASASSSAFSYLAGSGLLIAFCACLAIVFIIGSIAAFVIAFQRQRGTLDIVKQEQRLGKDNLDEEAEGEKEVGVCTTLLEIETTKPVKIVASEELEECL